MMLRQAIVVFMVIVLVQGTAFGQTKTTTQKSVNDGYSRPPMDVGVALGAGAIAKDVHWLVSGADVRAQMVRWLGLSASYEFIYYGEYRDQGSSGPPTDYSIFAHRAMAMARFYPGGKPDGGLFIGIGGGAQWLHGLTSSPNLFCWSPSSLDPDSTTSGGCSVKSYSVKPAAERHYHVPSGMFRASVGGDGIIGRVVIGGELTFDVARIDPTHYYVLPSLRARVAYRF